MRKLDNRGISLMEIMIVIAIMAVVAGVGIWGVNALTGRPAQQCGQKIIYSLERHRMSAMGKVEASYTIKVDTDGTILCIETFKNDGAETSTTVEIAKPRVKLSYEKPDGSIVNMGPNSSIKFVFDRGSGAFKELPCNRLIIRSGGREVKVRMVKMTGKVYLD